DTGTDPSGRYSGASVRCRHGGRDARAERRGEHVPMEGAQRTDSPRGAPDTFLPPGASARFCLDGSVHTTRRPADIRKGDASLSKFTSITLIPVFLLASVTCCAADPDQVEVIPLTKPEDIQHASTM